MPHVHECNLCHFILGHYGPWPPAVTRAAHRSCCNPQCPHRSPGGSQPRWGLGRQGLQSAGKSGFDLILHLVFGNMRAGPARVPCGTLVCMHTYVVYWVQGMVLDCDCE